MLHQKALYLQEMGIARWQVRKPALFIQGSGFPILDLSGYQLLFVCTTGEFELPLTSEILKAFKLKKTDVCCCSLEQFENQQGVLPQIIWSTLGTINQPDGHALLTSPGIATLAQQPQAKKQLWEQFCALS
ncbi:MAG: DNA polymerase III subunit psi [Psychromonas sp.]